MERATWRGASSGHFQQPVFLRESETSQEVEPSFQEKDSTEEKKNLSYLTAYFKPFQLISEKMTILPYAGLVNTDLPSLFILLISKNP